MPDSTVPNILVVPPTDQAEKVIIRLSDDSATLSSDVFQKFEKMVRWEEDSAQSVAVFGRRAKR